MKTRSPRLLAGLLLTAAALAPSASAAPVTVNLRVEGPTSTLYEGPITTDARSYTTPKSATDSFTPGFYGTAPFRCDVTHNGPGRSSDPAAAGVGTPTTALNDWATRTGNSVAMTYYGTSGFGDTYDFFVTSISGIGPDPTYTDYWQLAIDGVSSYVGGCQIAAAPGQEIIWAYSGASTFLKLDGSAVAQPGDYIQVRVRDTNGNPIQGAAVGGQLTDSAGHASIIAPGVGQYAYKAAKAGTVRSNQFIICVHQGNDGNCGYPLDAPASTAPAPTDPGSATVVTPAGQTGGTTTVTPSVTDKVAPEATVSGIDQDEVFAAGKGPRELSGTAGEPASRRATLKPDPSGLASVQIRLLRRSGKTCSAYDGKAERFKTITCGRNATYFSVGTSAKWRYLLPARLGTGSYVLDVLATDKAGNADTKRRPGSNRISFRVR